MEAIETPPVMSGPMSDLIEDKALDIVDEEAFKEWLGGQGFAWPEAFRDFPNVSTVRRRLDDLYVQWDQAGRPGT